MDAKVRNLHSPDVEKFSFFIDREAREIIRLEASIRPFVCLYVYALLFEPFDL